MKTEAKKYLRQFYEETLELVGAEMAVKSDLPGKVQSHLDEILRNSESSKGVLTVITTSIVYKIFHPEQDIRKHQSGIEGGYSGRTFDSSVITPFLKSVQFPAMAESGWLTRSLEQKIPYDLNYTGAIKPPALKEAFLGILAYIEEKGDCEQLLGYLFQGLIIQRNKQAIELAKPIHLPIRAIVNLLSQHFSSKYKAEGAARLPTLALYAVYQCLLKETKRFAGMNLAPIESHTTSDRRSGRIGDIEVTDEESKPFEAVEVKHGIPVSAQLVRDAYEKFMKTRVDRYYLLSTNEHIDAAEKQKIETEIERIKNLHGCQVIPNGLLKTLAYYLRLLANPADFVECYVDLLEQDNSLKFEHKLRWNELNSGSHEA